MLTKELIEFVWKEFRDVEYSDGTEEYLDSVIELMVHLSRIKNRDFNYCLEDIGFCEKLAKKVRNEIGDVHGPSKTQSLATRVSMILEIIHNVLFSQNPPEAQIFISRIIV